MTAAAPGACGSLVICSSAGETGSNPALTVGGRKAHKARTMSKVSELIAGRRRSATGNILTVISTFKLDRPGQETTYGRRQYKCAGAGSRKNRLPGIGRATSATFLPLFVVAICGSRKMLQ